MRRAIVAAFFVGFAPLAVAPNLFAAQTLDELLEQTKHSAAREAAIDQEREREFLANRDRQQKLLEEAEQRRAAAEVRSHELSARFDENEKQINELDTLRKDRSGNLSELFAVVRQTAGDTATALQQSLISAEFPGRDAAMKELASAKGVPTIKDLEGLWYELQREMTESGRVVRRAGHVIAPSGEKEAAEIVRVGPFIAVSNGRYLTYLPAQNSFAVLSRQPPRGLVQAARALQEARQGTVHAALDPSRGVILAMYVDRPNVWERIQRGESVGYVIIAVGVAGALLAAYQFLYLLRVRFTVARQLARLDDPRPDNPLGRVLLAVRTDPTRIEEEAEVAELRVSEAVLREIPALERFQSFLRLAVGAGPLLGLIGTVIGMIITFQSITESGSGDPKLMATGIGQAMIATVLGLGIAIPLLFANAGLASLSKYVVQILDEQSTGILAETIEKKLARDGSPGLPKRRHAAA